MISSEVDSFVSNLTCHLSRDQHRPGIGKQDMLKIYIYNVCPYVARRTVCRDENGKLTSHALPHKFVVLYVTSNDSSAVCPQGSHNSERNLSVLVVIAVSLLIAQSNARHSPPCYIVGIARYSNFGDLMLKCNTKDNEPCVGGMNKFRPTGKGGILCAPGGSVIAADMLCYISASPNHEPSYLCSGLCSILDQKKDR